MTRHDPHPRIRPPRAPTTCSTRADADAGRVEPCLAACRPAAARVSCFWAARRWSTSACASPNRACAATSRPPTGRSAGCSLTRTATFLCVPSRAGRGVSTVPETNAVQTCRLADYDDPTRWPNIARAPLRARTRRDRPQARLVGYAPDDRRPARAAAGLAGLRLGRDRRRTTRCMRHRASPAPPSWRPPTPSPASSSRRAWRPRPAARRPSGRPSSGGTTTTRRPAEVAGGPRLAAHRAARPLSRSASAVAADRCGPRPPGAHRPGRRGEGAARLVRRDRDAEGRRSGHDDSRTARTTATSTPSSSAQASADRSWPTGSRRPAGASCVLERGQRYPPGSFPRSPYRFRRAFWDPSEGLYGMFSVWSFDHLGAIVGSGLGGGSLIYANVLLRKDPEWFVKRGGDGGGRVLAGDARGPGAALRPSGGDARRPALPLRRRSRTPARRGRGPSGTPPRGWAGSPPSPPLAVTFAADGPPAGHRRAHPRAADGRPTSTAWPARPAGSAANATSAATTAPRTRSTTTTSAAAQRAGAEIRDLCEVRDVRAPARRRLRRPLRAATT